MFTPKAPHVAALAAAAALFSAGGGARARLPDVPEERLRKTSTLIIEAVVVATRLLNFKRDATHARAVYHSELEITRVVKGDKKPGEIVTVGWSTRRWVGKGRKPVGHWIYPVFHPCEKVFVYLYGTGSTYTVTAWNGKRTLAGPPSYRMPVGQNGVVRCKDGNPGEEHPKPPPPPADASVKGGDKASSQGSGKPKPKADAQKARTKKRKHCGCGYSQASGSGADDGAGWVLWLVLSLCLAGPLARRKRR